MIEPVIGEKAQDLLKAPLIERELHEKLSQTLEYAEERFRKEYSDVEVARGLINLPLADLPSLQNALRVFYVRPTGHELSDFLRSQLASSFRTLEPQRLDDAAIAYVRVLKEEIIPVSSDIRDKLSSLALLGIQESAVQTQETIAKIYEVLRAIRVPQLQQESSVGSIGPDQRLARPRLYSSRKYPLIIDASAIIDSTIAEVEKQLGQSENGEAIGIGELDEIPDGGQSRVYNVGRYGFYVNYDKKGVALGLQVFRGLIEDGYSLDDWSVIFSRVGVAVSTLPDVKAPAARRWNDYLGYGMWLTADKVGGQVWTVKVHKLPRK
jgi:hypothetical protein